jgi:hypothetical protein
VHSLEFKAKVLIFRYGLDQKPDMQTALGKQMSRELPYLLN